MLNDEPASLKVMEINALKIRSDIQFKKLNFLGYKVGVS